MIARYLVILVLLAHGVGHIMGFLASWTKMPMGFTEQPWLFSNDVTAASPLGKAFGLLWLVALILFLGAAFGLLGNYEWWRTLAIIAAVLSLVVILPWWNTVTPASRLAAVVVDLAILIALIPPWGEQISAALTGR